MKLVSLLGRLSLLVLTATVVSACGDDDSPPTAAMPAPLTSADVLKAGPYAVGVTTMTFVDTSRPTMANGSFPGAPSRTLVTEIWYPAAAVSDPSSPQQRDAALAQTGRPYPLVVYSHGFLSDRSGGTY